MRPEDNGHRPHPHRSEPERHALRFDVKVERTDALTHVELLGELDMSCEDRFGDALDTVRSGRLVLDLGGLTFIDSAGLRMIFRTWQRSRQDGFTMEIVGGRDQVERVFRITGLDGALPIVDQISLNGDSPHSSE